MSGEYPTGGSRVPVVEDDVDQLLGQIVQEQMAQMQQQHEHDHMRMMQQQVAQMQQVAQLAQIQHLQQMQHLPQMQQLQQTTQVQAPQFHSPFAAQILSMANVGAGVPSTISRPSGDVVEPEGMALSRPGTKLYCPLRTHLGHSCQEEAAVRNGERAGSVPEIKAYKLGKKRWSYNQVDVVLKEKGGKRELYSKQAIHKGIAAPELCDMGGICYQVTLNNDEVIQVHTFLVYEDGSEKMGGDARSVFEWELVNREDCKRGCQGSTLRALQRFGRLGKRTGSNCNTPKSAGGSQANSAASTPAGGATPGGKIERSFSNMKDSRYMYLSLDEAVTHCRSEPADVSKSGSNQVRCFRLICGAFAGTELISTSVSPPIRVLANNDVPGGAAHIEIQLEVESSWPGWNSSFEPLQLQFSQGIGQSMSMSHGTSQGGMSHGTSHGMSFTTGQGAGMGTRPGTINHSHSLPALPTLNLPSPSTRDMGRIHSDESMLTPQRLSSQLRKTMSVSSGQKRLSSLLDDKEGEMVLRRTQSMKKGKKMINLTARSDTMRGLASPFTKMQVAGQEDETGQEGEPEQPGDTPTPQQQDPVSAFVELMMTTFDSSPKEQVPVVEIPRRPSPLNLETIDDCYLDSFLGAMHANTTFPETVDVDIYGKDLEK